MVRNRYAAYLIVWFGLLWGTPEGNLRADSSSLASISVSPASGTGASQTFSFVYSDPNGAADISWVQMHFQTQLVGYNACYLQYTRSSNAITLVSDAGTAGPAGTLGSSGTLSNSQCTLSLASSSVSSSGNILTVNLALTFSASFVGAKNISMNVINNAGAVAGWQQMGSWTIAPTGTAPVVSLSSPVNGSKVTGNITVSATAALSGPLAWVQFYVDSTPVGSQLTTPPFTVNWNSQTVPDGAHTLSAIARDASGNQSTATISVTVSNNATISAVTLPVEVMAASGSATQSVPVNVSTVPGGPLRLSLQIHGVKYQTEASVQINSSGWIPLNNSTVTLLGRAAAYGGIGGGYATLNLTMNIPAGAVVSGTNTISFQFNGTDGNTSGFRVLSFNILGPDGSQLVSSSNFVQDDPTQWQPPSNLASDISAGKQLWTSARLTTPNGPIVATCGMCHTEDGRDLKYFNYSNYSIRTRAMFHGLTAQQGNQIASYIRSLNVPVPSGARPWNPPYQPGPGTDSKPVTEWAAGAGLGAVLDNDADMIPYLMPGGSTATWAAGAHLNVRETPIALQLLDWNRWLPTVHPLDAFGAVFTNSTANSVYLSLRSMLRYQDATSYAAAAPIERSWSDVDLVQPVLLPVTDAGWNNPSYVAKIYSIRLWEVVKLWEINQEFGLEGMAQVPFGPQAPSSRAWYTGQVFFTSPFQCKIPSPSPGIGNGQAITFNYFSYAWYHMQILLNDGNGQGSDAWPVDWGYTLGYPAQNLTWDPVNAKPRAGTGALLAMLLVKSLQSTTDNSSNPAKLVHFPTQISAWSEMTSSQKLQLMNGYTAAWLARFSSFNAQSLLTTISGTSATLDPTTPNFGTDLVYALPELAYQGVDSGLLNQMATWAAGIWPTYNWSAYRTAPCAIYNYGEIICSSGN